MPRCRSDCRVVAAPVAAEGVAEASDASSADPTADEYADAYWTEVAYGPQEKCEVSVLKGSPPATCATRRIRGVEDPAG